MQESTQPARNKINAGRDEARKQHEARGKQGEIVDYEDTYADFGPANKPPEIHHDHGFLDDGKGGIDKEKKRKPNWSDRFARMRWVAKLEAAELLRPDLVDATTAYRHFLFGRGKERSISYERFVANDNAGQRVLASVTEDTRISAIEEHDRRLASDDSLKSKPVSFQIQSDPVAVGNDGRYPYPTTENWQKAIGAHKIWIKADVTVTPENENTRVFEIKMTLHMEDRYNFNPGAEDLATGIPDDDNGRFELTGLGQEFMHTATLNRTLTYSEPMSAGGASQKEAQGESSAAPRGSTMAPLDRRPYPAAQ